MIKKITFFIFLILTMNIIAQVSGNDQGYNSFTSRSFMKFNRFLTVPTFSLLHEENTKISLLARNTNVSFNDSPRFGLISYCGRMSDNVGAGIAVYQQRAGVFSDLGAVANYVYQVQLNTRTELTFGFNFTYSRRAADGLRVLSPSGSDPTLDNYQDLSIVNFQPAITVSFGNIDAGIFLETLVDYNLKKSKLVTPFSEKVISGHAMYTHVFENASGFFQNTTVQFLAIAKKQPEGFGYGANLIVDLPKLGWIKGAYDKNYGIQAGLGVNLSKRISIGFSYERGNLGTSKEVGVLYTLGKTGVTTRRQVKKSNSGFELEFPKREKEDNNASRIAQDSINKLNKELNRVLTLLKNKPEPLRSTTVKTDTVYVASPGVTTVKVDTVFVNRPVDKALSTVDVISEDNTTPEVNSPSKTDTLTVKDTSLRRSKKTPWREKMKSTGGGGIGHFVAINQFKSLEKTKKLVAKYKGRNVAVKYIKDPLNNYYYIYIQRFKKKSDADDLVLGINKARNTQGFENNETSELGMKMKSVSSDPVYRITVDFSAGSESYKEPKKQAPARISNMQAEGVAPGYYMQVTVNSKKALADKNVDELRADNIDANYFINPKTGYHHVYIYKSKNKEDIINLYNNNLNGSFYNPKVIVHIK